MFYPDLAGGSKYRLLVLIKVSLVLSCKPTVLVMSLLDLWISLNMSAGPIVVGAMYRQCGESSKEKEELSIFLDHDATTSSTYACVAVLGDLKTSRGGRTAATTGWPC